MPARVIKHFESGEMRAAAYLLPGDIAPFMTMDLDGERGSTLLVVCEEDDSSTEVMELEFPTAEQMAAVQADGGVLNLDYESRGVVYHEDSFGTDLRQFVEGPCRLIVEHFFTVSPN